MKKERREREREGAKMEIWKRKSSDTRGFEAEISRDGEREKRKVLSHYCKSVFIFILLYRKKNIILFNKRFSGHLEIVFGFDHSIFFIN